MQVEKQTETVAAGPPAPRPWQRPTAAECLRALQRRGCRGLPGGSTLAQLLAERRHVPNLARPRRLTEARVLRWADAHRRRTGRWPGSQPGPVEGVPGETWYKADLALWQGNRSLPGGDTLLRLLRRRGRHVPERRGRPKKAPRPP
jgi:hypothetical protein